MHNIGNITEAEAILAWVRSFSREYGKPTCVEGERAPEGWEYIGTGSFRSVWLSPSGVAYKVDHNRYDSQSLEEVDNLRYAWRKGALEGCRLPRFDSFIVGEDEETVIAIELIKGKTLYLYDAPGEERDRLYDRLYECENTYGLGDLHDENVIVDEDGLLVPVDFGG